MPRKLLLLLAPAMAFAETPDEAQLHAKTGVGQFAQFNYNATRQADFTGIAGTDPADCDAAIATRIRWSSRAAARVARPITRA